MRGGFRCKPNKEHWLGEGIYFYTDKSLAEWWTTNPTKNHGIEITVSAIIECLIEVPNDKVLNLCTHKWKIWESRGVQARADIPSGFSEIFVDRIINQNRDTSYSFE